MKDRSSSSSGTLSAPVRFGKYLLERRIAVGGSSEVFLARATHEVDAKPIVIKRLLPHLLENHGVVSTFAVEARLHRSVRHPNVVEVYEAGSVEGEPYLAMEYVPGLDAHQLLRRTQLEKNYVPIEICVFIGVEVCRALARVHSARDDDGSPLDIVHRDVTPSNIYLGTNGDIKLGDFGIARQLTSDNRSSDPGQHLKGKFAYLSPEQVTGDDFDHRADLFSLAVVIAELLINGPLFPGSGQLAVLLAIRDGRIDALTSQTGRVPAEIMKVLVKALSRDPAHRYQSADLFREALEPFISSDRSYYREILSRLIRWAEQRASRAHGSSLVPGTRLSRTADRLQRETDPRAVTPVARVRRPDGQVIGPLAFAKIIEMTATQRISGVDEVDMRGDGFERLSDIPELSRHLSSTTSTEQFDRPGVPDYVADLSVQSMLNVCVTLLRRRESGVLFAERDNSESETTRKEVYLAQSKIIHVGSSRTEELLGEFLVRRGSLTRDELQLALAVMPRYNGRIGDTLIALGMVDAVQLFRAIRDQGRERVVEIFKWKNGRILFYRGTEPGRIEFPLDLDLPLIMHAGVEATVSDEQAVEAHKPLQYDVLRAVLQVPDSMRLAAWPADVLKVVGASGEGRAERDVVTALAAVRLITIPQALRAIDIATAAGLLVRVPAKKQ